jgi:cell division protein FtsB
LHALSLKVIQEQQKQIEELKQKQAALEQRLLLLESKK